MHSFSNTSLGLTVAFTDECVEVLMNNRRDRSEAERGGLLFASPLVNDLITISKVSQPTSKDRSGKYFFIPDLTSSQDEIERQFKNKLAYVGDWHTHPTVTATSSPKDMRTIKSIFRDSTHCLNYILMIIVGTSDTFSDSYFCLTNGDELYELE